MDKTEQKSLLKYLAVIVVIALGCAVLWLNYCIFQMAGGESEGENSYRYHFAMVVDTGDNPYWEMVFAGASQQAASEDAFVELMGSQLSEEYALNDRLQMAIAARVDGIFVVPDGSDRGNQLIRDASGMTREVPVLTVMENDSNSGRNGYVGINSYEQGQAYGRLLEQLAGETSVGSVVILTGSARTEENNGDYSSDIIYSSLVEYLSEHQLNGKIAVSTQTINHASIFNTKRDIQRLLRQKEATDVVICPDYQFTLTACQVAVEQNLVGQVDLLGSYISEDVLDYVQKGTLYGTVAVDPYELGRTCVDELIELNLLGRTNDYTPLEMMTIDQSNVKQYREQYLEEQG